MTEQEQQITSEVTSSLGRTASTALTTPLATNPLLRTSSFSSPYSAGGLYGGSSLYSGGLYGGNSFGMMNGFGGQNMQNPNQNPGFRQDYQQVFQGLRAVLQMGFSAFGLFTYGKMFGSMMIKMVKFAMRKCTDGTKALLAWTIFNRYSTKVLNGIFTKADNVNGGVFNLFFKGLFSVGILAIALIWFLIKSSDLEERETDIIEKIRKRKALKRKKLLEFENCNFLFKTRLRKSPKTD